MSHQQSRLHCQAALLELIESGTIAASIASRDGLPVLSEWNTPASEDLFVAMAAAMYGAADACNKETGQDAPQAIRVEGEQPFSVHRLDDDYLLVALGDLQGNLDKLRAALHA